MTPVPFKTDDAILALSLYISGAQEMWPPLNIYDENILRRLGYSGVPLEDAARQAFQRKDRGHVEYYFERTPELDHFVKAYRNQQAIVQAEGNDTDAGAAVREIMRRAAGRTSEEEEKAGLGITVMDEREAALRIACILLKTRVLFVNRWKDQPPYLRIAENGSPVTQKNADGETTRFPGFKLIPVTLPAEKRKNIGL